MNEQVTNAAFTETDIQKINGLIQQMNQAVELAMRARITLHDVVNAAILRHQQIEAQAATETEQ